MTIQRSECYSAGFTDGKRAVSLGMPAEAGKGQETHSPLQPQNTQPHRHLDFSSMKLMSEVYSTELEENKFALF